MYRSILAALFVLVTSMSFSSVLSAAERTDIDRMQGKWEVKKTNEEGQKYTQTIEMDKDMMTFKIVSGSGETLFLAKAKVNAQKAGPFNTFKITEIKHGRSEDSLESADEERAYVYQLNYDTLTIVSNIDAERDEAPRIDVYKKVSSK